MPIQKKDITTGLLVWWTRSGDRSFFDCPGVVTKVTRSSFRVLTFDDFKESGELLLDLKGQDNLATDEMRICNLEEVGRYFAREAAELSKRLIPVREELIRLEALKTTYETVDVSGAIKSLLKRSGAKTVIEV